MPGERRPSSPSWQARRQANEERLRSELASGRPIYYRRVPGTREYYNPRTGERASEHYVVRQYRPSLPDIQRENVRNVSRRQMRQQMVELNSLASTYAVRQTALGNPMSGYQALRTPEFMKLYRELRQTSFQARHTPLSQDYLRARRFAGNSRYARLLTLLGRRTGLESPWFFVGDSPTQVGYGESYIDKVVLPALRSGNFAKNVRL